MKDAYSFDATPESLDKTYMAMYDAYCRIFTRCGLKYVIVEAETGEMGGSGSHQFTIPCESGEDMIVYTDDGSYAANLEKAAVDPLPKEPSPGADPRPGGCPHAGHRQHRGGLRVPQDPPERHDQDAHLRRRRPDRRGPRARRPRDQSREAHAGSSAASHVELADEEAIRQATGATVGFAGPSGWRARCPS